MTVKWYDATFAITDGEQEQPYCLRLLVRYDGEMHDGDALDAEGDARLVGELIARLAQWRLIESSVEVAAADDQVPAVYLVGTGHVRRTLRGVALTKTGADRLIWEARLASSAPVEVTARTPTEIEDGLHVSD